MHARADAAEEHAATDTSSWPDEIFSILQRFDVRQVPYVPDAGHSQLIDHVLASSTMRGVSLTQIFRFPFLTLVTMRGEWGEFNPWQVPMGSKTEAVFELSGIRVLRATHPQEVREVVEAGAMQAYNACTPTAVLLSQRLIGSKVFVK